MIDHSWCHRQPAQKFQKMCSFDIVHISYGNGKLTYKDQVARVLNPQFLTANVLTIVILSQNAIIKKYINENNDLLTYVLMLIGIGDKTKVQKFYFCLTFQPCHDRWNRNSSIHECLG